MGVAAFSVSGVSRAQVAEVDVRTLVFSEPSPDSHMTILNPSLRVSVTPFDALTVSAGYEADIVSGASEPIKAGALTGPDIVSHASVTDLRHVASGGLTLRRKDTTLGVSYGYGTENDYRSHSISVSGATEFLQRNTRLELAYSRGFDQVCNAGYDASLAPTLRPRLDTSEGCFTDAANRKLDSVDLDSYQAAWTQSWTRVFTTQLVATFGLQHGFLGNPYRAVVIGAGGQFAQEHHPESRGRAAVALRGRYFISGLKTAVGFGVRGYHDTWDIISQTYELNAERYLLPWLRLMVRGRYYSQSAALFWSDDYTGGEPVHGPRGAYFTGDRELSPLNSYLLGGRVLMGFTGGRDARVLGAFSSLDLSFGLDVLKTDLKDYTWGGNDPSDTLASVVTLGLGATF